MTGETLRALSRAYALGDIDREAYRVERRELLNGIVAGTIEVERFVPPDPETPTVFPYDDDDGDTTQEILPQLELTQSSAPGLMKTAAIGVGIIAIALLVWLNWPAEPKQTSDGTPAVSPANPLNLFEQFLADNSWHKDKLTDLARSFEALPQSEREKLHASPASAILRDAIVEQIGAESALLILGDAETALDNQQRLLQLAERLEFASSELKRAKNQWLVAHADITSDDNTGTVTATASGGDTHAPGNAPETVAEAQQAATGEFASETEQATPPTPSSPGKATREATQPTPAPVPLPTVSDKPRTDTQAAPQTSTSDEQPVEAAAKPLTQRDTCKPELVKSRRPYCIDVLRNGSKGPVLVVVPAGSFTMGGRAANEQPSHEVTVGYPLAVSMFEVSAADLNTFCDASNTPCPQQPWNDPALPAVNVSWPMATAYANWLSDMTGRSYRLPSEAEWEYVTRAGTQSSFPFGEELLPTHARYSFRTILDKPLAANDRSVNRNEFRIFHLIGNVREWVLDPWHENYQGHPGDGSAATGGDTTRRVVRGGSYADRADNLRSAARMSLAGAEGDRYTGFRVVRIITP